MKYQNLFTPYKIGDVTIKNRFCLAPMGNSLGMGSKGEFREMGIDYLVERARGGVGLIFTGALTTDMAVDPFSSVDGASPLYSPMNFRRTSLEMNDRIHAYGTKIFAQITMGLGRNYPGLYAPSELPVYFDPSQTSPALTKEQIKQKVDSLIHAAGLMQASGFDGIEIHSIHWGYLLDQFAMSLTNHRTDEYGGSLENRLRVSKEIIEGIKQVCGAGFPVSMRLGLKTYLKGLFQPSFDGEGEAGRTLEEGVRISQLLESYGYDALSVDVGTYDSFYYAAPPMYMEKGFTLDLAKEAKKAVKIPVLAGGSRIDLPDMCEKAIAEGKADAIVIGRPLLADAYLVKKIESGKEEQVRPCIGCNACIQKGLTVGDAVCAVNPTTIREKWYGINKTVSPKKVVVVGGGIAGMEAARVAKLSGHDVTLYEKSDKLGGNLIPAGAHDSKIDIRRLNQWLQLQLKDLDVSVKTNTEFNASDIKALRPDAVMLAVGSVPVMPKTIPGIDHEKAVGCLDALLGKKKVGQKVVIVGGGQVGCEMALDYAKEGKTVMVVEALPELMSAGAVTPFLNAMYLKDALAHYNVKICTGYKLDAINDKGAVISAADGKETLNAEADTVIIAIGFRPLASMAKELLGEGIEVYELGDGAAVGNICTAVRDAYEIARDL